MFEYKYENLKLTLRDYPASDHLVVREVFKQNNYEFDPSQVKVGLVIDLGANIGAFSCLVGRYVKVLAYEPESHNFELLLKNIAQNPVDVEPHQLAVGYEGFSTINDLQACSQLGKPGESVRVVSINSILDPLDAVDILKIDVEGSEYEIFEDITKENLLKCRRIVGEWHPPITDRYYRIVHDLEKTHYLGGGRIVRGDEPMDFWLRGENGGT